MGSPQALPQLKRALQGERSPCPRLLPPRSQQLTGSCSEPPSSPHPAPWGSLRCAKSRPGKQTRKVSLLWWLFSCCLQRRCDCFTGAGARHHSHTRVSHVSLTSPTDLGLPFIMGSLLVWGHRSPHRPQPLALHTRRALNWALFLSWILPCSVDPNFYSIPETFCSAFPPSSILFIFHYLLQSPHSQVRRQESSWPRERRKTGWMPLAAVSQPAQPLPWGF